MTRQPTTKAQVTLESIIAQVPHNRMPAQGAQINFIPLCLPTCLRCQLESYAAEQRAFREGLEKLRDDMRKKYEHASDYSTAGLLRWYADEITALLGKE